MILNPGCWIQYRILDPGSVHGPRRRLDRCSQLGLPGLAGLSTRAPTQALTSPLGSSIQGSRSWICDSSSWIHDLRSMIKDLDSWIVDPRCRVWHAESWWVLYPGSSIRYCSRPFQTPSEYLGRQFGTKSSQQATHGVSSKRCGGSSHCKWLTSLNRAVGGHSMNSWK